MSVAQSEEAGREPFEPPAHPEKARLTTTFRRLAADIAALTAKITALTAQLTAIAEEKNAVSSPAESEAKPRPERITDARLRKGFDKSRFDVMFERHVAAERREVLAAEAAGLARDLAGMGVGIEELRAAGWDGALQ